MLHLSTYSPRRMPSHDSSIGFCSFKSLILKSGIRKGADNCVANHLSWIQIQGLDLPINDYLRDDTLLKVTTTSPWYANLVNFMVTRYIPPGEDKKKLIHLSRFHLWDDPYLFKVCADGLLRRCIPMCETRKILERCHSSPYGGLRSLPYPCKSMAEWIFLAKHVWRRKRICAALPKMSEAWEYQFPRRHATKEQSSSGNIRHMGS